MNKSLLPFFKLGFPPCKVEKNGVKNKRKKKENKDEKYIGNLFRKSKNIKCVY